MAMAMAMAMADGYGDGRWPLTLDHQPLTLDLRPSSLNPSTHQRINPSTPQRLNLSTNKRHRPPLLDAPPVHLGGSDATLHTRHGHDDAGEHPVSLLRRG